MHVRQSIAYSLWNNWAYYNDACTKHCMLPNKVIVAESAPQADKRSVCVIRTTVDNISNDPECRSGLLVIAESLVVTSFSLVLYSSLHSISFNNFSSFCLRRISSLSVRQAGYVMKDYHICHGRKPQIQRPLMCVITYTASKQCVWMQFIDEDGKLYRNKELDSKDMIRAQDLQALISRWEIANVNLFTTIYRTRNSKY